MMSLVNIVNLQNQQQQQDHQQQHSSPVLLPPEPAQPVLLPFVLATETAPPQLPSAHPVSLACHDLSVTVKGKALLNQVNLVVEPGELLIVIGPSGVGMS